MTHDALNLAVVGHVDHGKSTLVGRLFYECGQIPDGVFQRLERQAAALGQPSLRFAFFTDTNLQERQRGISIETAYRGIELGNRRFNVIDVPGHKDFVKNSIAGIWVADAALLVVDAKSMRIGGIAEQTKEHLVLLKAFVIAPLIVAVNKMDTVEFSQEVFDLCRLEIESYCEDIAYEEGLKATYVPVSAVSGDNLSRPSPLFSWFSGSPLLEALHAIPQPARSIESPIRMPVLRTFSVRGLGAVITGRVESGTISPGNKIVIVPYPGMEMTQAEVRSIEWQHRQVALASAGDDIGILLTKTDKNFLARQVKKGAVIGSLASPPKAVRRFLAEITVIDHPRGIKIGYTPQLHVHHAALPCRVTEIVNSGIHLGEEQLSPSDARLENKSTGIVWLETDKSLVITPVSESPRLGRFVLRDGRTVAIGRCLETAAKSED